MIKLAITIVSCLLVIVSCNSPLKTDVLFQPEGCEVKSKLGDMLTMHYTGTLVDGKKFDSR